jgi:hypothetical protein
MFVYIDSHKPTGIMQYITCLSRIYSDLRLGETQVPFLRA